MNPLLATCGIGLLSMGMGAALTPDVLPTPVVPRVVVSETLTLDGAAGAPTQTPTSLDIDKPEVEQPKLDIEVFSRRMLPVRPASLTALTHAAIDARVMDEVMTPLAKRSLEVRNFSRVRLPRIVFGHEFEQGTGGPKAPKADYVAFRLTRTTDIPRLDKPEVVARGRVHRQTGEIELRFVADAEEVWYPTDSALKRLARLR